MNPPQPIKISEEAKAIARLTKERGSTALFTIHEHVLAQFAQLAINSATEKLTAENERLREAIYDRCEKCKHCHGSGRDNDGENYIDQACPECLWVFDALAQPQLPTTPNQGEQKR